MKELEIIVCKNGETEINVKGFKGRECEDATRPFEHVLGTIQSKTKKAEYYQLQDRNNVNQQGLSR